MTKFPKFFALAAALLLSARIADAADLITIVAQPGRFGTIEQAAVAEAQVNWWDDNLADDAACTESFAAIELRQFLARALHAL
jgi:hypothetical protein